MNGDVLQYRVMAKCLFCAFREDNETTMSTQNFQQSSVNGTPPVVGPDYATHAQQEGETAKVLALGGIAAGIASGLIVLLAEREKKPKSKLEQARIVLEETAQKARKEAGKVESGVASSLLSARDSTDKKGNKAKKDAKKSSGRAAKKAQKEADQRRARIAGLVAAARDEVSGKYHDIEKQAPDMDVVARQFRSHRDHLARDARKGGKIARKEAGKRATVARNDVATFLDTLKDRAGEAEKYVESNVAPRLKDLEKETISAFEVGKEKSSDLRKRAEKDLVPQAKVTADKLKHSFGDFEKEAAKTLGKNAAQASTRLSAAAGGLETQAKDAGDAVKRGGRETRSLLLWAALAGVLVFTVFLDEEQQKRLKETVSGLFGDAKGMYGDMKGQDGSFTS